MEADFLLTTIMSGVMWNQQRSNQNIAEGLESPGPAGFNEFTNSYDDNRCPVH